MIQHQIVCGILDNGLHKKLLKESDRTLEKCMNSWKAAKVANGQLKDIASHGAIMPGTRFDQIYSQPVLFNEQVK